MFTSKIIKKAWEIRRWASKKYLCPIMDVSWKECLDMARNPSEVNDMFEEVEKSDNKCMECEFFMNCNNQCEAKEIK